MTHRILTWSALGASTLVMAACAGSSGPATMPSVSAGAPAQELSKLQDDLAARERELDKQRSENERLAEQIRNAPGTTGGAELLPPNAKPGECYARAFVPPTFETRTERKLRSQASTRIETIPARFDWAEERVLVSEASTRLEVIPATYKTVTEQVVVKPATTRIEEVPAVYDWQEEQVLVKPATTVWKKGSGPIQRIDEGTGEIMCLVEVPAEYKTVRSRVLRTPASTRTVNVPAEYRTVERRIVDRPPSTREVPVPAQYKNVKVRRLVEPAQERRIDLPEEFQTVSRRVQVSAGRMEWRPVLCETNATPAIVTQIQRALQRAGHNPGAIDGVIGRDTLGAVAKYQTENRLPKGGLNYETIAALGVSVGR